MALVAPFSSVSSSDAAKHALLLLLLDVPPPFGAAVVVVVVPLADGHVMTLKVLLLVVEAEHDKGLHG